MSVIRTEKLTKFYGADRGIIELDLTVGRRYSGFSARTAPASRQRSACCST